MEVNDPVLLTHKGGVSSKNVEVEQLRQLAKQGYSEPTKDYIHVRPKKGQSTNSHGLAERVRREKISEMMKLLQEIVPGYDKSMGLAVMLDEIINYVQSLKQRVEFVSMKLANVNPALAVDIDQILSKDIINSRVNVTALGLGPELSSQNPTFDPLTQVLGREPNGALQLVVFDKNLRNDGFPNNRKVSKPVAENSDKFKIVALAAGSNITLLVDQLSMRLIRSTSHTYIAAIEYQMKNKKRLSCEGSTSNCNAAANTLIGSEQHSVITEVPAS